MIADRDRLPLSGSLPVTFLKKFASIVVTLLVMSVAGVLGREAVRGTFSAKRETDLIRQVAAENLAAVELVKPQLPMRLDEVTTFIDIRAVEERLIYVFEFDLASSDTSVDWQAFNTEMGINLKNQVCANRDMAFAIRSGARYIYTYKTLDDVDIFTISISSLDCP